MLISKKDVMTFPMLLLLYSKNKVIFIKNFSCSYVISSLYNSYFIWMRLYKYIYNINICMINKLILICYFR